MRRFLFAFLILVSSLLLPWPVTLALVAVGAAIWPAYVEGAVVFALIEGASIADRVGPGWLPLTAAALAIAGAAEISRPLLARRGRATV